LLLLNRDFGYTAESSQWAYWGPGGRRNGLAHPALRGALQLRNAAAALCALDTLRGRLPVAMQEVRRGLAEVTLPGRFEVLPGRPQVILDVAHNVEAAQALERNLAASGFAPDTLAVCGMLRDKDVEGVLRAIAPRVSRWYLAALRGPRAATAAELASALERLHVEKSSIQLHASAANAFAAAREQANENDKIVVFGSFLTVGDVKAWLNDNKTSKR